MNSESEPPLDISEFRCLAVTSSGVVVVFEQTGRRYAFPWRDGELRLSKPAIEGECGPHPAEVIDCLARAVAHRAARSTPRTNNLMAGYPAPASLRTIKAHLRDLFMRG